MVRWRWLGAATLGSTVAWAAGDLTRQEPIEVQVELGTGANQYRFSPADLRLETGKLYKLVLTNPSAEPHYFSSPGLSALVFTRKIQVMDKRGPGGKAVGEIKGTIREVELYPGAVVEWFFVPVATGSLNDLHCSVKAPDGRTHAEHGMVGTITVQ